jgi:hypothetical protein
MSKRKKVTPAEGPLPTEVDFDPWGGNLDAQVAWKNFGGLTVDEAFAKFRTNASKYDEDFMFMGGKAFAYYFPVLERHLTSTFGDEMGDHDAWRIAVCLSFQFEGGSPDVLRFKGRVLELSSFVLKHIHRSSDDSYYRPLASDAWTKLINQLKATDL